MDAGRRIENSKVETRLPNGTLSGEGSFPCDVMPIERGIVDIRVSRHWQRLILR